MDSPVEVPELDETPVIKNCTNACQNKQHMRYSIMGIPYEEVLFEGIGYNDNRYDVLEDLYAWAEPRLWLNIYMFLKIYSHLISHDIGKPALARSLISHQKIISTILELFIRRIDFGYLSLHFLQEYL